MERGEWLQQLVGLHGEGRVADAACCQQPQQRRHAASSLSSADMLPGASAVRACRRVCGVSSSCAAPDRAADSLGVLIGGRPGL